MSNTAVGQEALRTNTGFQNSAVGAFALFANTTGWNNSAFGRNALFSNTTGSENTGVGRNALINNTTGNGNVGIGSQALLRNVTGRCNTAVGNLGLLVSQGDFNSGLGFATQVSNATFTNCTAIGSQAVVNSSNRVRLGDAVVTVVEGPAYFTTSDKRFKSNITETDVKGLEFIKKLRPVVYNFDTKKYQEFLISALPDSLRGIYMKKDFSTSTAIRQSGFIAQEVEQAAKECGYNFNGVHKPESGSDNYSLAYSQFVVPLVKAVQEQQEQIEELKKQIKSLKDKNNSQKK